MLRFAADENFNNRILRGLLRQIPELDVVRIQDVGLEGADDPTVLSWCAGEQRLLLTHDVKTMPPYAFERVQAGLPMPGVFIATDEQPIGEVIQNILLVAETSFEGEWEGQVLYLPLK